MSEGRPLVPSGRPEGDSPSAQHDGSPVSAFGTAQDALSRALRDPASLPTLSSREWEDVIRFGRRVNLLARIAALLDERGLLDAVPPGPRAHLDSAALMASAHGRAVRREVREIERTLGGITREIVLLKGAAYLVGDLAAARGRLFSDIDILVPREKLAEVEAALMLDGWVTTHHSAYDQRYYRRWMHELPPMRHIRRLTMLDVHHAILPVTGRLRPESTKLFEASRPVRGATALRVLGPTDMVLHSAAHLFHNEELEQGLRDLADLDALLGQFGRDGAFWRDLVLRARELDLGRPLSYALHYVAFFFGTRMPSDVLAEVRGHGRRGLLDRTMDRLFVEALRPDVEDPARFGSILARKALYVRAHWLRMPPWLLAYHLTVKMLRREEPDDLALRPNR